MRQFSSTDEAFLFIRSLSVNYGPGVVEPKHNHPWFQLVYAKEGIVRIDMDNRHWVMPPRMALCVPAETEHSLSTCSNVALRTLYIHPEQSKRLDLSNVISVDGFLHEAILRICSLGALDIRQEMDRHLGALVVNDLVSAPQSGFHLDYPKDERGRKLAAALRDTPVAVTLSALCANAGLSKRTAERIFKKQTGISPGQWRRHALLTNAFVSLSSGSSVDVVARSIGYKSRSAFSEAFTKLFGLPPSRLRNN